MVHSGRDPIFHHLTRISFFSFRYDPITDKYHEGNLPNEAVVYGSDIRDAYGNDVYLRCTLIMRSLQSIARLDRRVIQLTLVIMLFSRGLSMPKNPSNSSLNHPEKVLQLQNYYLEHLWLYMEKLYGSTRAILTFSTLISQCLHIQLLLRDVHQDVHEKLNPSEVLPLIRTLLNHLS